MKNTDETLMELGFRRNQKFCCSSVDIQPEEDIKSKG